MSLTRGIENPRLVRNTLWCHAPKETEFESGIQCQSEVQESYPQYLPSPRPRPHKQPEWSFDTIQEGGRGSNVRH